MLDCKFLCTYEKFENANMHRIHIISTNVRNIKNVVIIFRISRWMKCLSNFHFLNYIYKDMNLHKYSHSSYDSTSVYANSHFYEYN